MDIAALKSSKTRNSSLKGPFLLRQGRNKQNKTGLTVLFLVYLLMFFIVHYEELDLDFISLKITGVALKYVPLT